MSQENQHYLLQITIGPVQDFISAARRTRDLWFGSTILSEISKAVAKSVHYSGCQLIFPNPGEPERLAPCATNASSDDLNKALNVANVILAEAHKSTDELEKICEKAKEAAKTQLRKHSEFQQKRLQRSERVSRLINFNRWNQQIGDLIEFYYAWVPIKDGPESYIRARKRVAQLLAARKNIRDFQPNPCKDDPNKDEENKVYCRVTKSSLDGLRESIFTKNIDEDDVIALSQCEAWVKEGEALDAVGMIKRMARHKFPSVSRVALDPWIRGRGSAFLKKYKDRLDETCKELIKLGALNLVGDDDGIFPYEGSVLLPSRHPAMAKEAANKDEADRLCAKIERDLNKGLSAPDRPKEPYLAFLCADGDRMGATLSEMRSAEAHRNFSGELSQFADQARRIVKNYHGVCVYTGGDDVMAFLPLDTALLCARELRDAFDKLMGGFGTLKRRPTLSVGLSIAHAMEDLELLLDYGRKAESAAKKGVDGKAADKGIDRNGLAVSVASRGNIPITVREQWKDDLKTQNLSAMALDRRLMWWAGRFVQGEIPNKFPYDLRESANFYDKWVKNPEDKEQETEAEKERERDEDLLRQAVQDDIIRIFNRRKDVKLHDDEKKAIEDYIKSEIEVNDKVENMFKDARGIRALADELILAQWIAQGLDQARTPEEHTDKSDAGEEEGGNP